jgi:inosine-uridine nucleoside N-ribohydrolase
VAAADYRPKDAACTDGVPPGAWEPPAMLRMRRALTLAAAVAAVATVACGGAGSSGTPLVVDTDLSSDDVVALLYLAQDPDVDLRAVTVSGTGLVHCPGGARIAQDVLAVAGRADVPVACGPDLPLGGVNEVPAEWRKAADDLFGLTLPPARGRPRRDAVALLRHSVDGADGRVTVLELAPMTTLGAALRIDPGLARRVRRVVAMAGALTVPGNAPDHPAAEANAWVDPLAAGIVLRSGAPVTLVPLDATNRAPATTFVAQALARYHYATPAATLAAEIAAATGMANGGSYFWDPLAAAATVREGIVRTTPRRVDIVTAGPEAGRLVPGTHPVSVASTVDRPGFERDLVATLLGGAPFAIPPHRVDGTLTLGENGCSYRGAPRLTAGRVVLDTVNRTGTEMRYTAGRLDADHTLADLRRLGRTVTARSDAPSWFTEDAGGLTPPHSTMTWVTNLPTGTTGETVLACLRASPLKAWVVASLPVFAAS